MATTQVFPVNSQSNVWLDRETTKIFRVGMGVNIFTDYDNVLYYFWRHTETLSILSLAQILSAHVPLLAFGTIQDDAGSIAMGASNGYPVWGRITVNGASVDGVVTLQPESVFGMVFGVTMPTIAPTRTNIDVSGNGHILIVG